MSELSRLPDLDYDTALDHMALELSEAYGIDPETARIGAEWGRDWWYGVSALPQNEVTREFILQMRDMTLDGLSVPRDLTEGRPTFRVRYAAEEAFFRAAGEAGEHMRIVCKGSQPSIIPDFARIDSVLAILLDTYRRPGFPYSLDSTRVPQDPRQMPRNLNLDPATRTPEQAKQLASFWFADCYYMRGVNDSNDMTINLAALYEDHPELFDFEIAATMSPPEIETLLLDYHLAVQHKQTSEHWVENAKRMVEIYDGNPLRIFDGADTYDDLVSRVRNDHKGGGFKGFQKKMTSMLSYFYMATGLIPYKNHPLPVDFHVIRLSVSQEMIRFNDLPETGIIPFDATTDFLREIFYDFADHHDISQLELCDVVWLFSRELCSHSPGNTLRQIGEYAARATQFERTLTSAETATPKQHGQYARSCGMCPIASTCMHNVPSGLYYKQGIVVLPDPKIHLDAHTDGMHDPAHILQAQTPVNPAPNTHAIDTRASQRAAHKRQRASIIRRLAHPTLDVFETPSLARYSFTRTELVDALGDDPEAMERVAAQATILER